MFEYSRAFWLCYDYVFGRVNHLGGTQAYAA